MEEKEIDELDESPAERPANGNFTFSVSRKNLFIGLIVLLVLVGAFFVIKFNAIQKSYDAYFRASDLITVRAEEEDNPLLATVEITNSKKSYLNKEGSTDQSGLVNFSNLVKGDYTLKIDCDGYASQTINQTLSKGDNSLIVKLKKVAPKQASAAGTIKNYINEKPLSDIEITIGDKSATTDKDGNFTVNELNMDSYQLAVSAKGYLEFTKSINITDIAFDLGTINLVPSGRIVFVSNRDKGKTGIYTSNYDGSGQAQLTPRIGDSEDSYPVVSPDGKKVAFSSNREGKKINGSLINNLYVVNIDGNNLTKVSDQPVSYGYRWLDSYDKILWQSYVDGKNHAYIYNVADKSHLVFGNDTDTINNTTANSAEDKIAYTISLPNNYSQSSLYWTGLNQIDRNLIQENKRNLYVIKFDNNEITYSYFDSNGNSNSGNNSVFYKYEIASGINTKLDEFEYPKYDGSVKSPDGKLKASINTRDGKGNVYITDLAGNNEKQLTSINTAQSPVFWSSDNKEIFFISYKVGESALYVVSVDGGTAKKVVDVASGGYGYGM